MPNILDSSGSVPLDYDEPPFARSPVGRAWAEAKLAQIVNDNAAVYFETEYNRLLELFSIVEVAITMPATLPQGVAGQAYEVPLMATGTGPLEWSQIGDTIPTSSVRLNSAGVLVWRVDSLPAAGAYALTFRCRGPLNFDDASYTLTVVAAASATVINSTTLGAITVGEAAVVPLDVSGTPPFRVRVSAGGPLPNGVSPVPGEVSSLAASWVTGSAQPGSEGAGVSTTVEVTGAGGVVTKVFASGIQVNRKPQIINAGTIQIAPGASGSYQLSAFGYPAPTFANDAGETWQSGITINSAGLISWTDQTAAAGTTSGNLKVTATVAGVGTDTQAVKFQVLPVATSNAPPVAMTYWADPHAGVSATGSLVDSWATQAGGLTLTGSGATRPTLNVADGRIEFTGGTAPTTLTTGGAGALALPLYLAFDMKPAADNPANTYRTFYDDGAEPRVTYNENGSSQHRILYSENDVTVYGDNVINRGARNKVQLWVNADGSWGQRINGVEKTGAAGEITTPLGWVGLRINGVASTTGFTWSLGRWAAKSGSVPDAAGRAQMDTWLDTAWSGGGGGGTTPPATLDVPNVATDSRTLGAFRPGLIQTTDATWAPAVTGNVEWHSPRASGLAYLTNQRSYWEGNAANIPRDGLVVTTAGYKSLSLMTSAARPGKRGVRCQVNNTCPAYTGNGAAGRARLRIMSRYKIRTSAYAGVAPTPMIACWGHAFDDDMINATTVRQAICGLGHVTNVPVIAGATPPNAPGLFVGKEDPTGVGRLYWSLLAGASGLNSASVVYNELKDILADDAVKVPQVGVPYFFACRWLLSYLDEGYCELWMRSPAHYGGTIRKVYERFGPNFFNDSYGESAAIGPQDYHWEPTWTAPYLSHGQELFPFAAFRDVAGTPTLTPQVMFAWMDAQA